jgi:VanZ family protein
VRVVWLLVVFIVVLGSLLPENSLPMRQLDRLHLNDKFEHFAAYTVLAFLPPLYERWLSIVLAAVGAVLLGIGLEYAQLLLGWRHFEIGDMIADTGGVCFGLLVGIPIGSSKIH